ncbi:unnamed protein product [Rotaria sp. Silwood1]|nr:unnamed protein product [Rotaria sp. Silwood1]
MCNKVAYEAINIHEIPMKVIADYMLTVQQHITNINVKLNSEQRNEKCIKEMIFKHDNFEKILPENIKGLKFIQENITSQCVSSLSGTIRKQYTFHILDFEKKNNTKIVEFNAMLDNLTQYYGLNRVIQICQLVEDFVFSIAQFNGFRSWYSNEKSNVELARILIRIANLYYNCSAIVATQLYPDETYVHVGNANGSWKKDPNMNVYVKENYSFIPLKGRLFKNGHPMTGLPNQIISHPHYNEHFGTQNFPVEVIDKNVFGHRLHCYQIKSTGSVDIRLSSLGNDKIWIEDKNQTTFSRIEDENYILALKTREQDSEPVMIYLPRLNLKFKIEDAKIISEDFKDYRLSEDQHINTLFGLSQYLVIERDIQTLDIEDTSDFNKESFSDFLAYLFLEASEDNKVLSSNKSEDDEFISLNKSEDDEFISLNKSEDDEVFIRMLYIVSIFPKDFKSLPEFLLFELDKKKTRQSYGFHSDLMKFIESDISNIHNLDDTTIQKIKSSIWPVLNSDYLNAEQQSKFSVTDLGHPEFQQEFQDIENQINKGYSYTKVNENSLHLEWKVKSIDIQEHYTNLKKIIDIKSYYPERIHFPLDPKTLPEDSDVRKTFSGPYGKTFIHDLEESYGQQSSIVKINENYFYLTIKEPKKGIDLLQDLEYDYKKEFSYLENSLKEIQNDLFVDVEQWILDEKSQEYILDSERENFKSLKLKLKEECEKINDELIKRNILTESLELESLKQLLERCKNNTNLKREAKKWCRNLEDIEEEKENFLLENNNLFKLYLNYCCEQNIVSPTVLKLICKRNDIGISFYQKLDTSAFELRLMENNDGDDDTITWKKQYQFWLNENMFCQIETKEIEDIKIIQALQNQLAVVGYLQTSRNDIHLKTGYNIDKIAEILLKYYSEYEKINTELSEEIRRNISLIESNSDSADTFILHQIMGEKHFPTKKEILCLLKDIDKIEEWNPFIFKKH